MGLPMGVGTMGTMQPMAGTMMMGRTPAGLPTGLGHGPVPGAMGMQMQQPMQAQMQNMGQNMGYPPRQNYYPHAQFQQFEYNATQNPVYENGFTYWSIDVECAATGIHHNARAPCRVALVDVNENLIFDVAVRVDYLVSPLTPITGMHRAQIDGGYPLEDVQTLVRKCCGPRAVLIGQSILHDIEWLQLQEGQDFGKFIDLADVFKITIPTASKRKSAKPASRIFCLEHEAWGLLGITVQAGDAHSPVEDACISIKLWRECAQTDADA